MLTSLSVTGTQEKYSFWDVLPSRAESPSTNKELNLNFAIDFPAPVPGVISELFAAADPSGFEPLIDAEEAAELLGGIHPKTLMRWARNGEVPGYQFARSWFFRKSDLDAWLRAQVRSNATSLLA